MHLGVPLKPQRGRDYPLSFRGCTVEAWPMARPLRSPLRMPPSPRAASACRPAAAAATRRGGGAGASARPRWPARPHARRRRARLDRAAGAAGVGKTTSRGLLADATDLAFVQVSAIFTGVADLKKMFEAARSAAATAAARCSSSTRSTASTAPSRTPSAAESKTAPSSWSAPPPNPSFELNSALLSRARVLTLRRLDDADLEQLLVAPRSEPADCACPLTPEARWR